jgi:hypothetical protein
VVFVVRVCFFFLFFFFFCCVLIEEFGEELVLVGVWDFALLWSVLFF